MLNKDFSISVWDDVCDIKEKTNRQIITIPEFVEIIRSDKYKDVITKIRNEPDKKLRSELKKSLPAVTASGVFKTRMISGFVSHSQYICLDFDDIENIETARSKIVAEKFVSACFLSASGQGLAALVRIKPDEHERAFDGLVEHFEKEHRLIADIGCRDVSRLRFVSHDPLVEFKATADVFKGYPKKEKPASKHYVSIPCTHTDIAKIVGQIQQKGVSIANTYPEGCQLAASLATLGEAGREFFHICIRNHATYNYNERLTNKKFDSFLKGVRNITIGTFYHLAKQAGIKTNREKSDVIVKICSDYKRNDRTVEDAITLLKSKNVICVGGEQENKEDIELVENVYNNTDTCITTGIQEIEDFIAADYPCKRNEITGDLEAIKDGRIMTDVEIAEIYFETKKIIPQVHQQDVIDILESKSIPYNPIKDFIEANRHCITSGMSQGAIDMLADTIVSDSGFDEGNCDAEYEKHFITKWLVGVIASIYGHTSPLLLALVGAQNTGKTEWFRRLLPNELKKYYGEPRIDADKDACIAMSRFLIIMDDELSNKGKVEEKHLKELLSKKDFSLRLPYGRKSVNLKRLAVLCGTTNESTVLCDPTGNRRIIPIRILEIKFDAYNELDKTLVFMEAVRLFEEGYAWHLSACDIERLNRNTIGNEDINIARELVGKYYYVPVTDFEYANAVPMTVTDIMIELRKVTELGDASIRKREIAFELKKAGFKPKSMRTQGRDVPYYAYMVCKRTIPYQSPLY